MTARTGRSGPARTAGALTLMPCRGTVSAADGTAFTPAAPATGLGASFAAFLTGQTLMSGQYIDATLGRPGVIRAVLGGGLFLAACSPLTYGLGAVLRHTAGPITAAIALLVMTFLLLSLLPLGGRTVSGCRSTPAARSGP